MSSRGSTTAATPASSSPIRYDAQPRSSWVTCRKSTRPTLSEAAALSGRGLLARGAAGQRVAALRVEQVDLARVHPQPRLGALLDGAGGLKSGDRRVLAAAGPIGGAGVGGQLGELLA